jgi:glucose-1-phosphate cytidylyltransferase
MTGGRLKRVRATWQDESLLLHLRRRRGRHRHLGQIDFHRAHGRQATLTAVFSRPARFGALDLDGQRVRASRKSRWARAGASMAASSCSRRRCSTTSTTTTPSGSRRRWPAWPRGQLMAFEHDGFWQPMDTLRDKNLLEELWASGKAPWKSWT